MLYSSNSLSTVKTKICFQTIKVPIDLTIAVRLLWFKIVNDILCAMENKKVTALMAIDLSVAFNTVDHSILITVFRERFGITDTALSLFESYLHLRYCKVNVGTNYSKIENWYAVCHKVPVLVLYCLQSMLQPLSH